MAAIDSFDDVRRLTEPELRALFDRGTAEERLWALVDVRLLDHVVVGGRQAVSLAERGWL